MVKFAMMSDATQRFIAYALLGYIDAVARLGNGDAGYNYVIGSRIIAPRMRNAGVRTEIVDLFEQLEEIEALIRMDGGEPFGIAASNAIRPVLELLRLPINPTDRALRPIDILIQGGFDIANEREK